MIIEVKKLLIISSSGLFHYHNDPPCGAVWSGLSAEGGAEQAGRAPQRDAQRGKDS